jgi:hypothetical protein
MTLDDVGVRQLFEGEFAAPLAGDWAEWRGRYLAHVERVQAATREQFITTEFQEALWNSHAVTTIGPGRSVTIEEAYSDVPLARALFEAWTGF